MALRPVDRLSFYAECRQPDLAAGDDRLYANVLLTIGYIEPAGNSSPGEIWRSTRR